MQKEKYIIIFVTAYLLLLINYSFSQEHKNSGFTKPMNLAFNLAGSFGEPRPDHFHSGIDIKTNGVEGEPVFAVYDGYVSRIRISPYGYGRAIYITHPNGFTTVYGHLSKFNEVLEKYVHAQHYLLQKSELDLTLFANIFPVKQGDTIAFSGNTGGSSAPHLHFEIRDSKTEHALNPLGFYPKSFYVDTIPPQINKLKVNELLYSTSKYYQLKKANNYFTTINPIEFEPNNIFTFSLEGFDKQDNSENKNGIKKIEVFEKDSVVFRYDLTEIDFDKTRMCNLFVDYDEMMNDSGYFYNCFQSEGNLLSIYFDNSKAQYKIDNKNSTLYIYCYDYNENKTIIQLNFVKQDSKTKNDVAIDEPSSFSANKYINAAIKDSLKSDSFKIIFNNNALFEGNSISIINNKSTSHNELSTEYKVCNIESKNIPLQKAASIEFKSSIKKNRNKIVVVRQDNKGKETALTTTFDKNKFYAETKELGSFYLKYDTTKPIIEILNLNSENLNKDKIISAKMLDELSGINTYNGYIDDKWVNFYYDAKNDVIEYTIDEHCTKGEHILKIIVTDNAENKTIVQQKFVYN